MFHLKEHVCNVCGYRWRNNLDISICPRLLDHTQIMRERIQKSAASPAPQEKNISSPLTDEPLIEK